MELFSFFSYQPRKSEGLPRNLAQSLRTSRPTPRKKGTFQPQPAAARFAWNVVRGARLEQLQQPASQPPRPPACPRVLCLQVRRSVLALLSGPHPVRNPNQHTRTCARALRFERQFSTKHWFHTITPEAALQRTFPRSSSHHPTATHVDRARIVLCSCTRCLKSFLCWSC